MATSLEFKSPVDPDSTVLVNKEQYWTNIKVYAKGGMHYQASNSDELRQGVEIEVEGLGSLNLILKSELEVTVNGTPYHAQQKDVEEKVSGVSAIFWVLTGFSAVGLLFLVMLSEMLETEFFQILIGMQIFAIVVYGLTAILLRRGIYWFYFVGSATFLLFTALSALDLLFDNFNLGTFIAFGIRIVLLVLVLRILPTILKRMRNSGTSESDEIVLDQH